MARGRPYNLTIAKAQKWATKLRALRPAAHPAVVLLAWAGHAVADFLTHADDLRPLFWSTSD